MLNGSIVYSSLGCTCGYHHIVLSPEVQKKSAFVMPIERFEFKKVPFGLVEVPVNFQQIINEVLKGLSVAFRYLDNILVFSENNEKHLKDLRTIFDTLWTVDVKLKRTKCYFFKCDLHYLGHLISEKGIYPFPEKLKSTKGLPVPRTPKEVKKMLDVTGFYQKFISAYTDLVQPLTQLTHKTIPFIRLDQC